MSITVHDRIRDLSRAAKRLDKATGDISLRHARQAMLAALRRTRETVDASFPAPVRKRKEPRKRRNLEQIWKDLTKDGWVTVQRATTMHTLNEARVRMRWGKHPLAGKHLMAPSWAVRIAESCPSELRAAARSPTERKAIMMRIELSNA